MRLKLIACEVLFRELCQALADTPHTVDVQFAPKGLHDIGAPGMLARMQQMVDAVDEAQYDAVMLGYALCNNGIAGLTARGIPLVVPRAHDCITLFLGSKEKYHDFFHANPGVYFHTAGWIERGTDAGELQQLSVSHQMGMDSQYKDLVEKYGEDNAKYLFDMLCNTTRNYSGIAYIAMGLGSDSAFEEQSRRDAAARGWSFTRVEGDMRLFRDLLEGRWDEADFLVVPPGQSIAASHGSDVISITA
ncbi:MAG: DUF1638 domain-containing protein [Armatimonadetes bacterium]|nr:DUF1638 domain-containing protein [Armatimonadota bacterium]